MKNLDFYITEFEDRNYEETDINYNECEGCGDIVGEDNLNEAILNCSPHGARHFICDKCEYDTETWSIVQ